jgi:hypothetical protein
MQGHRDFKTDKKHRTREELERDKQQASTVIGYAMHQLQHLELERNKEAT